MKEDTILPPVIVAPTQHSLVAAVTKNARMLVFMLSELKLLQDGGKGSPFICMALITLSTWNIGWRQLKGGRV